VVSDEPKPKKKTPFSHGGSHYRPPSGPGWGGDATGREAKPYDGVYEAPGAAKAAGKSVAAEIRDRIAAHKLTLADKLVHLAQHAEAETVQLAATNSALDRLMGKPAIAIGGDPDGVPIKTVVAWEGEDA
jgi:hypothetical protein